MKLLAVLNSVNQIEKTSFLRILDGFCGDLRGCHKQVDAILVEQDQPLKHVDNENLVALFALLSEQYTEHLTVRRNWRVSPQILPKPSRACKSLWWSSRLSQWSHSG